MANLSSGQSKQWKVGEEESAAPRLPPDRISRQTRRSSDSGLTLELSQAVLRSRQQAARRVKSSQAHLRRVIKETMAQRQLLQTLEESLSRRRIEEAEVAKLPNKNRLAHYEWLRELLVSICQCRAPMVFDMDTGAVGNPLFAVAGACPSIYAGMQSIVYSAMYLPDYEPATASSGKVPVTCDFWWVKPIDKYSYASATPSHKAVTLQSETLSRHSAGKYKNSPGQSKGMYAPLATLLTNGTRTRAGTAATADSGDESGAHGVSFAMEEHAASSASIASSSIASVSDAEADGTGGDTTWRAAMRTTTSPGEVRYLVLVWQESWSSPFARTKFISGKLLYQKGSPTSLALFAAPYRTEGTTVRVAWEKEEDISPPNVIPPDCFKLGCDLSGAVRL